MKRYLLDALGKADSGFSRNFVLQVKNSSTSFHMHCVEKKKKKIHAMLTQTHAHTLHIKYI